MFHPHSLNPRDVLKLHFPGAFQMQVGFEHQHQWIFLVAFHGGVVIKKNRIPGYQWWCSAGSGGLGNGGYFFAFCLIQEWPGKYSNDVIGIKDMQNQQSCRNRWTRNSVSFAHHSFIQNTCNVLKSTACKALWQKSSSGSFPFSCEVF